jgi:hypothetical protein
MTDWGPDDLERTAYHEAGAPAAKEAGRAVDRELRGIPSPDAAGRLSNVYR